jgi:hypothetical protein
MPPRANSVPLMQCFDLHDVGDLQAQPVEGHPLAVHVG